MMVRLGLEAEDRFHDPRAVHEMKMCSARPAGDLNLHSAVPKVREVRMILLLAAVSHHGVVLEPELVLET
jgi:hypothetical protein